MTSWYERNREKAIANAKTWRLNNLERFQALNRASKARKRATVASVRRANRFQPVDLRPVAPEGYDPAMGVSVQQWCINNHVPFDRNKW